MVRRKSHRKSERGASAILVALSMSVLASTVGVAIDLARAVYARTVVEGALQSAATAAAAVALSENSKTADTTKMYAVAKQRFKDNGGVSGGLFSIVGDVVPSYDSVSDVLTLRVDYAVPMTLTKIMGYDKIQARLESSAQRPRPAPVELAIVADVTSSMNDPFGATTKLGALKSSATSLVTTLMKGDYVKVGLLPVAGLVRLDTANNYHDPVTMKSLVPWLVMAPDPKIQDCKAYDPASCTYKNYTCYNDGVPFTCSLRTCTTCTSWQQRAYYWDGCMYYRRVAARTTIANPTVIPYYGLTSSAGCYASPVITDLLTKGKTYISGGKSYTAEALLQARIAAFKPPITNWGTYLPDALIWGWNMLTTETTASGAIDDNFPLNSGYTADEVKRLGVRKALVLITDGNNTLFANPVLINKVNLYDSFGNIQNPGYTPAQQSANLKQVNTDMVTICQNIKNAGIKIYIIALQFSATDLSFKSLLRDQCSSGSDYFYDVADPAQLNAAFKQIGSGFTYNTLIN